jgi:hypothetical protein
MDILRREDNQKFHRGSEQRPKTINRNEARSMNIFVTGATGVLGSEVVPLLVAGQRNRSVALWRFSGRL